MGSATNAARADEFDPTNPNGDRRRADRTMVCRPGTLRIADAPAIAIQIGDLHRDGCQIDADVDLDSWQVVTIGIPGVGQHEARVMWSRDGMHGCAFERALPSGAVTAAMSENVHSLPGGEVFAPVGSKASPRYRVGLLIAMLAASGAVVVATVRSVLG